MALARGIRLHQYLDDWLIRAQFQEEAQVNTQTVVELTQSLGWIINQEKSELKNAWDIDALNINWYGPALPPRLDSHSSRIDDASGHNISTVEEPSRLPSAKPKKSSHSFKQYDDVLSSASDHYSDQSDDPRPAPSRAKKHTDKSKHKSRSRYLPSSSEEDQSSELRHRSPKPSGKTYTDQDHPQHDPDPPYYREIALSDIPSQYSEEVDTFRRILKLPDPRDSLPMSSTAVMGLDDEKGLPLCCL